MRAMFKFLPAALLLAGAAVGSAQIHSGDTTVAGLDRRCAQDDGSACAELGDRYSVGRGVLRDAAKAAGYDAAACDKGIADRCYRLGEAYQRGNGVTKNPERAATLFKLACTRGLARACTEVSASSSGRADAAILAGSGGASPASFRSALAHERGDAVPVDKGRAASLYAQSCDEGYAPGCFAMGRLYERGEGVARNDARAAGLFATACDAGVATACYHLGVKYASAEGVGANAPRADGLFRKACGGGVTQACGSLSDVIARARPSGTSAGLGREFGDAPPGFAPSEMTTAARASMAARAWKYFEDYRASLEISPSPVRHGERSPVYLSVVDPSMTVIELQYTTDQGTTAARTYRQAVRFRGGQPVCLFAGGGGDGCIVPDPPIVVQMAELRRKYGRGVGPMTALQSCIRTEMHSEAPVCNRPIIGNERNTAPIYGSMVCTGGGSYAVNYWDCASRRVSVKCLKGKDDDFDLVQGNRLALSLSDMDYYDRKAASGECIRTQ